jgi:hypothetical protein
VAIHIGLSAHGAAVRAGPRRLAAALLRVISKALFCEVAAPTGQTVEVVTALRVFPAGVPTRLFDSGGGVCVRAGLAHKLQEKAGLPAMAVWNTHSRYGPRALLAEVAPSLRWRGRTPTLRAVAWPAPVAVWHFPPSRLGVGRPLNEDGQREAPGHEAGQETPGDALGRRVHFTP